MESLPPENRRTGFSNSAATSRMMWIDSASSTSRCESCVDTSEKSYSWGRDSSGVEERGRQS